MKTRLAIYHDRDDAKSATESRNTPKACAIGSPGAEHSDAQVFVIVSPRFCCVVAVSPATTVPK
jgi:hypothetical protein